MQTYFKVLQQHHLQRQTANVKKLLMASSKIDKAPLFLSCADASYVDPLGPQVERPKTGAKKRVEDDDFADEELGDDLLPE